MRKKIILFIALALIILNLSSCVVFWNGPYRHGHMYYGYHNYHVYHGHRPHYHHHGGHGYR